MTRREERAIHEQHEEIVKESWQEAADAIMGLNPDDRALLVALADGQTAYGNGKEWRDSFVYSEEFFAQFFKVSYMDDDVAKLTPTSLLEQVFAEHPRLKEGVSKTVDRHKLQSVQAGMHHIVSYGGTILPYWWWTK